MSGGRKWLIGFIIGLTLALPAFMFARGRNNPSAIVPLDFNTSRAHQALTVTVMVSSDMMPNAALSSLAEETPELTPVSSIGPSKIQTVPAMGEGSEDQDDVLLLYDSAHKRNFDINFRLLARYYGVGCRGLDLKDTPLTEGLLKDAHGEYFKLIGVSAQTLEVPSLISPGELDLIKQSIKKGGANLLVAELIGKEDGESYPNLQSLTDNMVHGAEVPKDSHADWFVSNQMPELTKEFTGQAISCTLSFQPDYAITLKKPLSPVRTPMAAETAPAVISVITSTDDSDASYPIFVHCKSGAGSILVSAGDPYLNLNHDLMRDFYEPCTFSRLVSLMFAFRFALGDEVWHSSHAYANLTIDDPPLRDHYLGLRYAELLAQMKEHNFHTTIAFEPINYDRSDPLIARLFLTNPDHLSIVQHGNNNDEYEFYKYEVSPADPYPARPLAEQKADIIEGLARMEEHRRLTGIPYGKIMIFPYSISPAKTLVWLKVNNFNATINSGNIPLGSEPGDYFDFDMYQAIMNYGNFPSIGRRGVPPGGLSEGGFQWLLFDLFIGKPALLYSHVDEVFRHGMDGFNQTAEAINRLPIAVEWHSLDYIVKRLYLEKRNDDGSIDVKWYGNHLIVTNASDQGKVYHLQKEETLNVPIVSLTVNGHETPFRVEDDVLLLDLYIPAMNSAEVVITYGS